ncbi:bifunctional lysylphosphatidylglycerol flippase/synthetase MprF [Kineococcus aurantiacus]|uniref:Phosphatidylglycerol lysyltransferase n=1 Tax=Kineococcus aurantiacus TaxID=37633 RepID=A0A7Y9DPV8_9ACTN|nr:phosphatidylglycerol lysyltransferase [Kineococcus aurantiacus]
MSSPTAAQAAPGRRFPVRAAIGGGVAVAAVVVAVAVLHRTFGHLSAADVADALRAVGPAGLLLALAATACSHLAMTGYDALALRHVGHRMPFRRYGTAAFVATAFGNSLGASAVVGAVLRARFHTSWGVSRTDVARVVGLNLLTLTLGAAVLVGGGALLDPTGVAAALHVSPAAATTVGAVLAAGVLGYLLWTAAGPASVGLRGRRLHRPAFGTALAQVVLSSVEWLAMAAVLFVLLPPADRPPFLTFAVAFATATVAGLLSSTPGGVGVFESTLLLLTGPLTSPAQFAAALVGYRLCYFLVPMLPAVVLLLRHELRRLPALELPTARAVGLPTWLALGVGTAGAAVVVAGDVPGRAVDTSHVTTGLIGLATVLLAWGLHRRLRAAWTAAVAALLGLAAAAALRDDLPAAAVTALLAAGLLPARPAFHRGGSLLRPLLQLLAPRAWRAQDLLLPLTAAALVGPALWWHEVSGHAGGPGRGWDVLAVAAGAAGLLVGGRWVSRGVAVGPRVEPADLAGEEVARAADIVTRSGRCLSHLAFTGDKLFHFNPAGTAFLMYQVQGRSWVVMGDPVGEPADVRELVTGFVAEVDRRGGRPVFYNVAPDHADLYRACGLSLAKLGEEAVVPLEGFTLAGKARMGLRNCRNKSQKSGMSVEFVPAHEVEPLLPHLREVSDAWLTHRNGREKRFSLGAFDEDYVRRFPLVLVRHEGRVTAFATLWTSADGRDVQVDLMRRLPEGPRTVMTYLFVECILWAQENGYATFNMGMAPLSGLLTSASRCPGALAWERLGHLVWTHGERFYNFQGLRTFKQGFAPQWRSCYVAAPGGPALPTAMAGVATLVGGGVRGLLRG